MDTKTIVGKANTTLYSNGDVSVSGTLNFSKLEKYILDNPECVFIDPYGSKHITFKINKLKTAFEKFTHIFTLNQNRVERKQPSNSVTKSTKDEPKDDLPF
jgi:diphthamide biosynthesis methyltransferase